MRKLIMKKKILALALLPLLAMTACEKEDPNIEFDYIYTAQPVVSATNSTIFKNIQTEFATKSNGKRITQASVFISNSADVTKVDSFLAILEGDINHGVQSPALIKTGIEKVGSVQEQQNKYGVPGAMAMKVTAANNGFSLGYERAYEIKDEISSFVNLLTNNALSTFGDEHIYREMIYEDGFMGDYTGLRILAPTGAPAVALYGFSQYDNFTTTTDPQTGLIPQFKQNNYDVIIAPTQGGLTQIIKQNAAFKIAATITFGNFYLVSTGRDEDGILNESDKVCIFQENDIPGKVFNYLYSDLGLDTYAVNAASDTKVVIENEGIIKK